MTTFSAAQARYDSMTPEDVYGEEPSDAYIETFLEQAKEQLEEKHRGEIWERATELACENPPDRSEEN